MIRVWTSHFARVSPTLIPVGIWGFQWASIRPPCLHVGFPQLCSPGGCAGWMAVGSSNRCSVLVFHPNCPFPAGSASHSRTCLDSRLWVSNETEDAVISYQSVRSLSTSSRAHTISTFTSLSLWRSKGVYRGEAVGSLHSYGLFKCAQGPSRTRSSMEISKKASTRVTRLLEVIGTSI